MIPLLQAISLKITVIPPTPNFGVILKRTFRGQNASMNEVQKKYDRLGKTSKKLLSET